MTRGIPEATVEQPPRVIRIALLVCDTPLPHLKKVHGDYPYMFRRLFRRAHTSFPPDHPIEIDIKDYDVVDKMEYPTLDELRDGKFDMIVMTGSAQSAYDQKPWIVNLVNYIRSVMQDTTLTTKVVGVCFGHQIIGIAAGGQCVKNPEGWEFGHTGTRVTEEGKRFFRTEKEIVNIQEVHQDHVPELPEGFKLLLTTAPHTPVQAMISNDNRFITVQGHPEFTPDYVADLMKTRLEAGVLTSEFVQERLKTIESKQREDLWIGTFSRPQHEHKRQRTSAEHIVYIQEKVEAAFGAYTWPSALVLTEYLWHHRAHILDGLTLDGIVLELGAGTALPSLLLATCHHAHKLIITDIKDHLLNIKDALQLNHVAIGHGFDSVDGRVWIRELRWGLIQPGIQSLLKQVHNRQFGTIELVLGADTFYDPKDFERLLVTFAYIVEYHNPDCRFITAYQERSAKRSVQLLLDRWCLQARQIRTDEFSMDHERYTTTTDADIDALKNDLAAAVDEYGSSDEEDKVDAMPTHMRPHHATPIKVHSGTLNSVFLYEISKKKA